MNPIHTNYSTPIDPEAGWLLTVEEFLGHCGHGLSDYDGFGSPVKDGMLYDRHWEEKVVPTGRGTSTPIPAATTHIQWYNR